MKSDYEILGLKEGADEKEIKRAYFKLVRQFPPEKEPERFQEIREAYENLKSGRANKGFQLRFPKDPAALEVAEKMENRFKQRYYKYVMDVAERSIDVFGEYEGFLYFLAMAQRKLGFTGKSVQNFEKLVKMDPDNVEFAKELAFSYMERGYGKKAYIAFGKAYDMGGRDLDFLNSYAMSCEERKDYRRGQELLLELVALGMSNLKEYVDDQVNAYTGLFNLCLSLNGERLQEIEEGLIKFLGLASPYLRVWTESLKVMLQNALYAHKKFHLCEDNFSDSMKEALAKGIGSEEAEEVIKTLEKDAEVFLIDRDDRLSEIVKILAENFKGEYEVSALNRFAQLDCRLCMIEEWPGIKKELRILEECYPHVYEDIKEFEEKLERTEKLDVLRDRYLKEYDREILYVRGGVYYERYPYRKRQEKIIADSGFSGQPYTRMQPKVGRNDPCPCGSGKKYKKCCGK